MGAQGLVISDRWFREFRISKIILNVEVSWEYGMSCRVCGDGKCGPGTRPSLLGSPLDTLYHGKNCYVQRGTFIVLYHSHISNCQVMEPFVVSIDSPGVNA